MNPHWSGRTCVFGRTVLRSLGCIFLLTTASIGQKTPQYTLEINSNGLYLSKLTLGHAFMVIKVRTDHGFKEDAFGFYSDPPARPQDLPRLVIGTRGALHHEFDRNPERFAKIEESIEIPITYDQRKEIYKVVNEWNNHHYSLLDENCIKFVDQVVEKTGVPIPDRGITTTANQYIVALRKSYAKEQDRAAAKEQARAAAERENTEKEKRRCESGVFQEANPNFIWNLTFDGDDLTGQRTDGHCYFRLSRTGETWSGFGTCGQQRLNLVMRANDGCTQLTSNLTIFCPVLNRK